MLIVDGANVVGSRPTGWWKDRAAATERLHRAISSADLHYDVVVLVLEGAARRGHPVDADGAVRVVHAAASGDDAIVAEVLARQAGASAEDDEVVVVTADRRLRERVTQAGGSCVGPAWLLDRLPAY